MENNITRFEINSIKYARSEDTGYCVKTENGKHTRIGKAEFEAAYDLWIGSLVEKVEEEIATEEAEGIAEEMGCEQGMTYSISGCDVDTHTDAEEATESREDERATSSTCEAADAKEEPRKAKKTTRKRSKVQTGGMEFSEDDLSVILTPKQVTFIKMLPMSDFWDHGVDSGLWIDTLCDELAMEMGPMTVGAMVSTLREKHLLEVGIGQYGGGLEGKGRKAKYIMFTETGKKVVAKVLGL